MDARWTCVCGGHAYTREQMIALSVGDPDGLQWVDYWRSMLGPGDFYCSNEDDILTDMEAWRIRGLKLPGHDEDWSLGAGDLVWDGKGNPDTELIW